MSNVSHHKTFIDGKRYTDGGFTKPHVLSLAVHEVPATHRLIITNNDHDFSPISKFERLLNRTVYRARLNGPLVMAINGRRVERDKALDMVRTQPEPHAIVWGDGSVHSMEQDPKKVQAAIESSRIWWHGLLA